MCDSGRMSAQSVEASAESSHMGAGSLPDWVIPPPGGFTADDFLRMRDLPRHTELIDGSLVFVSPQRKWRVRMIDLLRRELDRQAPDELRADREMAVKLAKRQVPEPDVLVVTAEAYERDAPSTFYFAEDLVMAIEVVSPDSEDRDRDTKPRKYAAPGSGTSGEWRRTAGEPWCTCTNAIPPTAATAWRAFIMSGSRRSSRSLSTSTSRPWTEPIDQAVTRVMALRPPADRMINRPGFAE